MPRGTRATSHNVNAAAKDIRLDRGYTFIVQDKPWLAAECWCRSRIVGVQQVEVVSGRTRSCGRARCCGPEGERNIGLAVNANFVPQDRLCTEPPGLPDGERCRSKRRAPKARAYRAPKRVERDKYRVQDLASSRAELALRRDIVQLCWEAGMTVREIREDLNLEWVHTVANDIRYLLRVGRIRKDHTPVRP